MGDPKRAVERARAVRDRLGSGYRTYYVRASISLGSSKPRVWFKDRYYPSFDRPDWSSHFEVDQEEADAIVSAGLASYWDSREETWKHLTLEPVDEKKTMPEYLYVVIKDYEHQGYSAPVDGLVFLDAEDANLFAKRIAYGEVFELEVVDSKRAREHIKKQIIEDKIRRIERTNGR